MDLRRWGEFAFGIGVFMCGGAFLLLAVERLSAPVTTGVPVSSPVFAAVSTPVAVAAVAAPPAHPKPHHDVAANSNRHAELIVAAAPRSAPLELERPRNTEPHVEQAASLPARARQSKKAAIAAVHRPVSKRSPTPRILAVANRTHRSRIAYPRTPRSEATPEPPIGYDDHPALVRSDGPNVATATMEPVQVELTTTHLGH
jgi:hypothetical protein